MLSSSYLSVVRWVDTIDEVISDVVIFPIHRIVTRMGTCVTPVTAEVVLLVRGAGPAEREQLAGHRGGDLAAERLGLRDRHRAAGRFGRVPGLAPDLVQRAGRRGQQRLGRPDVGGQLPEAGDRVRVVA